MQEAKNVWRKKNKGRKWRLPDGACVSAKKGGSQFNLLFFRTSRSRQPFAGCLWILCRGWRRTPGEEKAGIPVSLIKT